MNNKVQFYNGLEKGKRVMNFFEELGYNWMHFIKVGGAISEPKFYLHSEGTPLFLDEMIMEERKIIEKMTNKEKIEARKKYKGVLSSLVEIQYGDYIVYDAELKQFKKE